MVRAAMDTEIDAASPADGPAADVDEGAVATDSLVGVEEILVEEVSIDGMCGVY